MPIAVGGLNHRVAPLELREKLAFSGAELKAKLARMAEARGLEELVVLSTCNRTEVYAQGQAEETLKPGIESILSDKFGAQVNLEDINFYHYFDRKAATHLFRVASSLDSLVLGENQILGQVREAYRLAQEAHSAGRVLSRLFQQAVRAGKRSRTETAISSGAVSVSSAAVDLARKIFGDLAGKEALILGAGEASELTLSLLINSGVESVLVSNRTYRKAVELAVTYHGTAINFEEFPVYLAQADILISSTSAPSFILTRERAGKILSRRDKPIFMIDLAVPRDIDPALAEYDNAFLYNIDDLVSVVEKNVEERRSQIGLVDEIVATEAAEFMSWYESLAVVPLIRSLHDRMNRIRSEELNRALGKLEHLSENDRQQVERLTVQMLNKFLHGPTSRLKENPAKLARMEPAELLRFLFMLDEEGAGGRE
ncbi:MAG: glutamyl-tRNA reductase [Candidatus Glassbacteria bacterium RIFCSPLOWO2_12_FULL_58_11]|uniref:Glutamyl-tRNA reductase n=1 Tax=Candidatus Glassbacteria bacterium RIFCSPLOWO2_12_FULL_58_11 TaxID=1817867 RepID=A0A1F5Z1H5_9BACT|nr:MAG: glutamyl-tRNA reductase [Candidatus Glassbacteria bacterium RIFCSPLOWO2_12_FULL_58_11]